MIQSPLHRSYLKLKCTSQLAQVFAEISHFKLFNLEFLHFKEGA